MGALRASSVSKHGGWQAQRSSSGARATSLEAAVAPIHHRRESACSLDVGLVPATLQRVVGLTRGRAWCDPSAAARSRDRGGLRAQWTDCRVGIGTEPRNWDESMLFPSSQPPTPGPRLITKMKLIQYIAALSEKAQSQRASWLLLVVAGRTERACT